jgi:hypothetical protein
LLDAVEDFMKGPDFFSKLDGEKMMKEKGKLNDQLSDIDDFKNIFVDLGRVYDNPPMTKKQRFIYQLTDNDHRFMPSFLLKNPSHNFAKILKKRIQSETTLNFTGTGFIILSTESLSNLITLLLKLCIFNILGIK